MKIVTIVLIGLLILGLVAGIYYFNKKDKDVNFGGIEISSENLADLTEPIGEGKFMLCSIKDDKCVISHKRNLG